ncbi:PhzF family phenazine biosynthesis protein [Kitasatospora sp. NBC_01539]|uniref:PhzF family phenazine biosynthesis protein n=1 Tax=Kitasatospora sp. NBC_01539 TaxID=2903577 RepID=UPI0038602C75
MRIRTIDAFTDRPFAGNPAAVCLLDGPDWPADAPMQRIAGELNLSETAFALPPGPGGDPAWGLRWFTPTAEVGLCGHATLATAHALHADGLLTDGRARFTTRSGVLPVAVGADGAITLDLPAAPAVPVAVPPGLAEALGAPVVAVYDTGPLGDLLVLLADEEAVRGLAPDLAAVARLEAPGVIVTAGAARRAGGPARAERAGGGHDFVSRFFGPAVGIPEDPVTGSAHTVLAPYWAQRLGRSAVTGRQLSARGGVVACEVAGDRVLLSGRAVTVLDGTLVGEAAALG